MAGKTSRKLVGLRARELNVGRGKESPSTQYALPVAGSFNLENLPLPMMVEVLVRELLMLVSMMVL